MLTTGLVIHWGLTIKMILKYIVLINKNGDIFFIVVIR